MATILRLARVFATLCSALALSGAVHAITNGMDDNGAHPYVGQLLFYDPAEIDSRFTDPGAWFSCSGTLISPTVVVTAGHCTFGIGLGGVSTPTCTSASGTNCGNDVWISFSEAPDYVGFPPSADYIPDDNAGRYVARRDWLNGNSEWVRGTAYVHPDFAGGAYLLHDLGVVVLSSPVYPGGYPGTFGVLPETGYLDQFFAKRRNEQRFTPVGYGLTRSLPVLEQGGDTREQGSVMLVSLNGLGLPYGTVVSFSNNPGVAHRGGTCYGDSGGPVLDGASTTIVAVTSFGLGPNCTGFDGAYRIDQDDDLEFLSQFPPDE